MEEVEVKVDSERRRSSRRNRNSSSDSDKRVVGLIYDERMCKHFTPDGEIHPENPNRIRAIWNKLQNAAIPQRCVILHAKEAEDKYIASVHTKKHIDLIRSVSSKKFNSRRIKIASKFDSIYLNEGSSVAAHLAAGSVIEVAERVAKGELNSAFAIVRPPGHHAEEDEPMGFCLYNNVAIATSFLLNERPQLGINKILIVDWDVHHGNGTQKMFWKDPRVLFFSVHRHEFGRFYPANNDGFYTMIGEGPGVGYNIHVPWENGRHEFGRFYPANNDGFYTMIGEGPGAGYNINVPWENGRCGDPDYLAVWEHILIPVAKEFNPDIIIISAGYDAAIGDPLGGCRVTPYGYSVMLNKLMEFARGKIVMALEGGYNPDALANSVLACVKVLLDNKPIIGSCEAYPFESTWRVIQKVRRQLSPFWPILADELPKLTSCKAPLGWRAALLEARTPSNSVMWGKGKRLLSDNEEEYEDVEGGEGEAREEKKDKEPEVLSEEQVGEEGDGLLFMLCLQDLLSVLQNVYELYYRSQRMAEDLKGKNISLEQTTRDLNLRTKELEDLKTQLATTISNAAKFEAAMKEAEAELQRFRELMNTAEANLTKAEADLAAEQAMSKLLHDEMAKADAEMETKLKAENDKGYNEGEAETLPECLKQIRAIEDASYKQGRRAALKLIRAVKDASYKQGWKAALLASRTPSESVLWGKDKRPLSDNEEEDEDVEGGEDEAREENNQGIWFLHPWTQVLGLHQLQRRQQLDLACGSLSS